MSVLAHPQVTTGIGTSEGRTFEPSAVSARIAPSAAAGQGGPQVSEFVADLVRRGDGLGNFGPKTLAEPVAEPLNRLSDGFLGRIEPGCQLSRAEPILGSPNIVLEQIEERDAVGDGVRRAKSGQGIRGLLQPSWCSWARKCLRQAKRKERKRPACGLA